MPKTHTTVRLSDASAQELAALVQHTGETQTGIISRALHDLHQAIFSPTQFHLCCKCLGFIPVPDWPAHKATCQGNGQASP